MSVTLTGTGGLFTRIGKIGKVADRMRTYQGTTLPTNITELMAQYDTLRFAVDGVPTADKDSRKATSAIMSSLASNASTTVIEMVKADKPTAAGTLKDALAELIAQMRTAAASVKTCTVTASAAAFSTPIANAGNGVCVVTTKRGDGFTQENIIPETSYITCTSDSQSGGATLGQETFTYVGEVSQSDVWAEDYQIGSGATATLTAIDATLDASGNLLTNSDFESFTSNTPDNWSVLVGTPGTDFAKDTSAPFDGTSCLKFIGGTGVLSSIAQQFNLAGGTAASLLPDTAYAINFWIKADVVPAAGVLTIDLVDANNTVINDDQGVANSFTVTLSGISTSYASKTGVFRTPRSLPSAQKIRVRISTAISAGSNIFFDRLADAVPTSLYDGGPLAAIFSGPTTSKFVAGDGFILTTTNDYGGSTNLSTFQQLFDRLFSMHTLGLLLPSNGSPTIADTLITA